MSAAMTCHDQYRLDGSHPEVVMVLLGELFAGQLVQVDNLLGEGLGLHEPFREQHDLSNEGIVRHHHGDGAEQILQVVRELHSACIPVDITSMSR